MHPLDWYVRRWLMSRRRRRGPVTVHAGIAIYGNGTVPRVIEALRQIEAYDPRRVRRLARDGVAIRIVTGRPSHYYDQATNVIALDAKIVARQDTSTVASSIVHEGAHARFASAGIRYGKRTADRIEARCVEEQISFVGRYRPTDDEQFLTWAANKRKRLERRWWTHKAQLTALAELSQAEGDPRWLVAFIRLAARVTWN